HLGNLNNISDVIASFKVKNIVFAKSDVLTNQLILDLMWKLKRFNLSYNILSSDSEMLLGKSALDKIDDIYLMQIEYNINRKFNILVKRIFDFLIGIVVLLAVYPFVFLVNKIVKFDEKKNRFSKKILLVPKVVNGKLSFVGRATWDTTATGKQFLGKNGLTGLVQINYYKNLTNDEIEFYNYYYAKNQSMALDAEIILRTISLILFRKNLPRL
ncbi:MAG TPA: sugar transferase, partial [Ignavibacteria bacterium]